MALNQARIRIIRRFGTDLPGLTRKTIGEKKHLPGQHGPSVRRRESTFSLGLNEKQKVKLNYGLSESQLVSIYQQAHRSKADTGVQLLVFLESRLDNVVFRAGFAPTIPAARQLVVHGHILVNERRVTRPSFRLSVNDEITVKAASQQIPMIIETLAEPTLSLPQYLDVDVKTCKATVKAVPERADIPLDVKENLIIEFYAR